MIEKFVEMFEAGKAKLREKYFKAAPEDYEEIVKDVVTLLRDASDEYNTPDPERITRIDYGDYQGTLLFVVAAGGYQPGDYWYTKVSYGSCSSCDAFQADDYLTLALHIVQGFHAMQEVAEE